MCLAATTQISQHRGTQPRRLSGGRLVSSIAPAWHLYEQQLSKVYEKPVYKIIIPVRDFSLDNAIPHKTAFKHPFIKYRFNDSALRRVRFGSSTERPNAYGSRPD
jgi:hypothetical protein